MKEKNIKIGVIGTGRWGTNHIKVLQDLIPKEMIYAADVDKEKLKRIAYLVKGAYQNYKEMINKVSDLKAVIIATPTVYHYEIAKYCLNLGLDVLVEKPISVNSEQALELIKIGKKNKKILFPGHLFLFKRAFKRIKKIFDNKYSYSFITIHRFNNGPKILDEGVIFDLAVHDIYITINLFNDTPISVYAKEISKNKSFIGASIVMKFKKGIVNTNVSWTALASTREYHIMNGRNEIIWYDTPPEKLIIRRSNSFSKRNFIGSNIIMYNSYKSEKVYNEFETNTLLEEDNYFLNSIITRRPYIIPEEGLLTVKIIEKIMESIKLRKEVKI